MHIPLSILIGGGLIALLIAYGVGYWHGYEACEDSADDEDHDLS